LFIKNSTKDLFKLVIDSILKVYFTDSTALPPPYGMVGADSNPPSYYAAIHMWLSVTIYISIAEVWTITMLV